MYHPTKQKELELWKLVEVVARLLSLIEIFCA